jgi:hypothetical protein
MQQLINISEKKIYIQINGFSWAIQLWKKVKLMFWKEYHYFIVKIKKKIVILGETKLTILIILLLLTQEH